MAPVLVAALGGPAAQAQTVQKTAEPFETTSWRTTDDSSATGTTAVSTDVPSDIAAASKHSLSFDGNFSAGGFQFLKVEPNQPLVIPGVTKKLSLWVKTDGQQGWTLQFKDGWGRDTADKKKLEWNLTKGADGTWKKVTFDVPVDWVQPISIAAILGHNWGRQSEKYTTRLSLDQLEVQTDISQVDPKTGKLTNWPMPDEQTDEAGKKLNLYQTAPVTPLLNVSFAGTQPHNVFAGAPPTFSLSAQNWRPQPATGSVEWKVIDPLNNVVKSGKQPLQIDDYYTAVLPLETAKFGVYRLDSTISWAGGGSSTVSQPFAVIPAPKKLTAAEMDASPYGLNVHSGANVMVSEFRKAGVTWFRDYGFSYEWMLRAKGADRGYGGWPYYPKIVKKYQENDARVLVNLNGAIKPPTEGVAPEPDLNWVREIVGIETTFPYLRYFELDNEYDLNTAHAKAEDAIDWKNYRNYHKKFAEITHLLGGNQFMAVENGRAGIWPERVRKVVQSGDLANIDVINSHHYSGTDAPEVNVGNHNMGFAGDETVMTWYDQLRATKRNASLDGKPRQHWLTEFGWDTKAGPVVSAREQAAYLPRAYMMLAAAGTDKSFWFFDKDANKATNFFDGCGLFTWDEMPKLSYAAYAGLTQILPRLEYIGMINAGEGTWGYLFRNEGKLVASLWTLEDKKGPSVSFEGARLYDYMANPLDKTTVELGMEPVYAVGVADTSRWAKQSAYELETPIMASATSGDSVTAQLQVKNTRTTPIAGKVRLQLPNGWTDVSGETNIAVQPGKTELYTLTFRVSPSEVLGEKRVLLNISEGEPLHTIPLRVQIKRPIALSVKALRGEPGMADLTVRVANSSARPLNGSLRLKLPASWSSPATEIKVDALKPMEVRDVPIQVKWTPSWKENEIAAVEYLSEDGRSAQQPLIPSRLTIYKAPNLTLDGDLKDWPARTRIPSWALGSTRGDAKANLYVAWSPNGLNVAVEVQDSKGTVPDPKSFWDGDVLELFVDTHDKKEKRGFQTGDHQFWLAPLINEKRVYAGQWKRGNEIPETKYDIPGVQGTAVRKGDGYVMECLIPASMIADFKPAAGAKIGLNLNLTVKGQHEEREVYWITPKSDDIAQPGQWGTVTLAE